MSGANSTPLGRMNPAIGSGKRSLGMSLLNPSYIGSSSANPSANVPGSPQKRDAEGNDEGASAERKRRRKSRWQSTEKEKTYIPGMPTVLPPNMDKEQEEAYLLQLQIEEMSRRLRFNDLGISSNPEDRSPSPEPIYNNEGKRLNTREYRTRKKLEEDRHHLIQKMMKLNTEYKPPSDYKPPLIRVCDKVFIPQDEHPEINFVGLLIGPRGNTLKSMEKETGAKIIIRGKGSVKEGKVGRKDGQPLPGEDEPLHAYITGTNPEFVKKAVDKIKGIIKQGVDVPESQNDLRRMQLRELALLNGTLRETDGPKCSNCGATTHKSWQCQDKPNITNSVVCSSCGGAGHIAKDCRQRQMGGPMMGGGMEVDRQKIDEEYMSLMAELGEGPPPQSKGPHGNDGNRMNNSSGMRGLFEPPSGPPRALMPSPHGSQGPHPMNGMGPNMRNTGPNNGNWGNMQGGFGGNRGPPGQNMNGSGGGDHRNQGPSFGVRPPMNWQQQQQSHGGNQQQGLMGGPPPPPPPGQNSGGFQPRGGSSLLSAPPPPPPPNNPSSGGPNQQPWMNSGGGPPNQRHQGNSWQGGMGGPPGPVPPPRPVGPPQNWGWNSSQSGGPRPPSGVDLGALLSAPPPPPPS